MRTIQSAADTAANAWLDSFEGAVAPLEVRHNEAWWRANTAASPDAERALEQAKKALESYLADSVRLTELEALELPRDEILARERDIALLWLRRHRMDPELLGRIVPLSVEIEAEYSRFRATLGAEKVPDNRLREILRTSRRSSEVEAAWKASKQIGSAVAERLITLVELRGELARRNGYASYHEMALRLGELDPDALFALLDALEKATAGPYRAIRAELDAELAGKFEISPSSLRPWHYGDPFFQSSPKVSSVDLDRFYAAGSLEAWTRRFFDGIGLEIGDILDRSDLYERDAKCQHAFCIHMNRRGDVRVLCNCRSNEEWMSTMLHEFGHAVYDKYLDPALPWLLREPSHTLTTEAIAMLCGRLSRNRDFLVDVVGANPREADEAAALARQDLRRSEIIFVRWALVMVHFERELYRDPRANLQEIWWDLVERFQMIRAPDRRGEADWASKVHIATAPVYYQNYILGTLTASQIAHTLKRDALGGRTNLIDRRDVGALLTERIFRPGTRRRWDAHIAAATGSHLDPEHFSAEFASP
jgi:peptidyl-dipeptidase A